MHAGPQPDRLSTLSEISRAVSATLELGELYDTIYREISRVMDATLFSIAIHEPEKHILSLPYVREEGNLFLDQSVPFGNNVTSLVIQRGLPLVFDTHAAYQEYAGSNNLPVINVGEETGEAVMFVPLHTGSRTIGTLSVESKRRSAYSTQDLETLNIIASQAAIAIENARLYTRSQDSIHQMEALLHVARTISQSHALHTVFDAILQSIRQVIPFAIAAVLIPDYTSETLDIMESIGPLPRPERVGHITPTMKIPFGEGVSGAVFQSGQPIIVPDVRNFPHFVEHGIEGVFSEMAVPLKRGDAVMGVLDIGRVGVDAFTPDEMDLLSLFASQAAIALENARLFDEQRRRVDELQVIESIVRALTPLQDREEIVSLIERELKRLIDYHACFLYFLDADGKTLVPIGATQRISMQVSVETGFSGWIVREGRSDIITSTLQDPRPIPVPGTSIRDESMVGAPLAYENRVQGVITLSKLGSNQFDENALRLLEIVAAQVAIAFDRARLYEELRTEALTDPLVRLWNRRYLIERFREERARASRTNRSLVTLMLDIDKFKLVNDTYGHDAGDAVLQELAGVIRMHTRTEDIVARYGGEEFCILLPDSSPEDAAHLAERLRRAIAEHRLSDAAGVRNISVSIGLAVSSSSDIAEEMFSRADAAMYHVKAVGGNRTCVAGEDGENFQFLDPR